MKRLLFLLSLLAAFATPALAQTKTDTLYFEFDIDTSATSHEFVYQFSDKVRAGIEVEYYDGQNQGRFKAEDGEKRMTIYGKGYWRIYCTYELPFVYMAAISSYKYYYDIKIREYNVHLTSLDVSNNTALTYLSCGGNQLTSLDVSHNTALTYLGCYNNQLTSLDVSNNTALTQLDCHNNQLTSLDVSNNTALTYLSCGGNQLTSLDVSHNTALTQLDCDDNQLTSLDVSNNTALTYLSCVGNQLTSLDVSHNTALTRLHCYNNQLTSLDVSNNTALTYLSCHDNQLTSLDVSNNTALTRLHCYDNQLTSLDVSNNTALTYLSCHDNQLTSLDVSNNTALTDLYCNNNQLTSLDVSHNTALISLDCYDNKLTSLDVSHNTALTSLDCGDNQLTSLDVSNNTALISLDCYDNQLTSLDVSHNTALTSLDCYDNKLTSLDVSHNTALTLLACHNNQLTSLDVSHNTALTLLACHNNQLTSLDVSHNTALTSLRCSNNHIPLSSLYNIYNQTSHWAYFYASDQTDTITLPINQVLDLSSERMLGENLSDFELSPASYTGKNFVFRFHKPTEYRLTLQNSAIPNANITYVISIELPDNYFTVQVESNNSQWGTATIAGDGFYEDGSEVTITATPQEEYRFVNWTKADGSVFSTEAVHTFAVTENLELTANFAVENFSVNLFANNPEWGYVFRTGNNYAYEEGDKLTVLALPNEGYRFVNWTKGSNMFSKDALFTFAVTENVELTANFEEVGDVSTESKKNDGFYVYAQDHKIHLSEYRGMVQVFNVTGQCVYSGHSTVIPVQQSGVYLVRVGASIYKVLVR